MKALINEMRRERWRQLRKWGRQTHSLRVWFWIWMEEVGEYYQAKLEHRNACREFFHYKDGLGCPEGVIAAQNVIHWGGCQRKELVQVLTVVWAFASEWRPWHGLWRIS